MLSSAHFLGARMGPALLRWHRKGRLGTLTAAACLLAGGELMALAFIPPARGPVPRPHTCRRRMTFGLLACGHSDVGSGSGTGLPSALAAAPAQGVIEVPERLSCGGLSLRAGKPAGAGAQGKVFAAEVEAGAGGAGSRVALKVSQPNAGTALARECGVLRDLEAARVPGVVRCVAQCEAQQRANGVPVKVTSPSGATLPAIVTSPFLAEARQVNAAGVLADSGAEGARVAALVRTAVSILDAGYAGVDVQVLQQQGTGRLLWIDFTEAVPLADVPAGGRAAAPASEVTVEHPRFSRTFDSFRAAAVGFVGEVFSLTPPSSRRAAASALNEALCERGAQASDRPAGNRGGPGVAGRAGVGAAYAGAWAELPWWLDEENNLDEHNASVLERCAEKYAASAVPR